MVIHPPFYGKSGSHVSQENFSLPNFLLTRVVIELVGFRLSCHISSLLQELLQLTHIDTDVFTAHCFCFGVLLLVSNKILIDSYQLMKNWLLEIFRHFLQSLCGCSSSLLRHWLHFGISANSTDVSPNILASFNASVLPASEVSRFFYGCVVMLS